jgi:hypothetical protein
MGQRASHRGEDDDKHGYLPRLWLNVLRIEDGSDTATAVICAWDRQQRRVGQAHFGTGD